MTATRRWCMVAAGVLLLVLVPFVARSWPVRQVDLSAADLLARVQASSSVGFSGYVESEGNLSLPVSDHFSDVSDLLGGRTTMRAWWRGADDWRVDKLTTAGETDLFRTTTGTTEWTYEGDRVVRTPNAPVRLPMTSDLLPPTFARRALDGARPDEVSRLASRRVAGHDAAGLRLRPSDGQSSIDHVDIWVEPASGLPLRMAVYAKGAADPAVTTTFLEVSIKTPPASDTSFSPPPGADVRDADVIDVAAAANRYAPLRAPEKLAGLTRRPTGVGAVGVYGHGLTTLVAIPLWAPAADPLRRQLEVTPGAVSTDQGITLTVGGLNLLLGGTAFDDNSWLLAGAVTPQTLTDAADQLAATTPGLLRHVPVGG